MYQGTSHPYCISWNVLQVQNTEMDLNKLLMSKTKLMGCNMKYIWFISSQENKRINVFFLLFFFLAFLTSHCGEDRDQVKTHCSIPGTSGVSHPLL